MLPILKDLSNDKVPNIRFNVCHTLEAIAKLINLEIVQSQFIPILLQLKEDKDKDVSDFAVKALTNCNNF